MGPDHSSTPATDEEVPQRLIEAGWKQGSVFSAEGVQLWCMTTQGGITSGEFVAEPHVTPSDGRFVVTSQTCDIASSIEREPFIEAFPCAVEADRTKLITYRRSFRWYEIDSAEGLVAHAMYRVPFDKRALLEVTPQPWPGTAERLNKFSTWLGRRAGRPAIPDPIVESFVKPLKEILRRLRKKELRVYEAFNVSVGEIRIMLPPSEVAPFEINWFLLLDETGLAEEGDNAIERVCDELRQTLNPSQASLGETHKLTMSRMSMDLYFNKTALIDLEASSFDGDDLIGAEPSPLP